MAGLRCKASSGAASALVSATAKTILQLKAPTNQRLVVTGFILYGAQAAGGTDAAVKVRMTRSTANFGTGTGVTPKAINPSDGETPQATVSSLFSAEPTSPTDASDYRYFNPESGLEVYFPWNAYLEVPGGQSIQWEFTSVSGTPSVGVTVLYEE